MGSEGYDERGRTPPYYSPIRRINFPPFTLEFGIDLKDIV
jgi:hypothetical protein